MKKIMYIIILTGFLTYILCFPRDAVMAASLGLKLWYEKMMPTLLPVTILSYILIHSGMLDELTRRLHGIVRHVFPISTCGLYPLFAGMLFGFPLGSKITAELTASGKISYEEGKRLFCICNNISPMFISGFIMTNCLNRPDLLPITYLILYLPPLVLYILQNHNREFPSFSPDAASTGKNKPSSMNFQLIDDGIMNGFETLAKLGGYIMLFAILAQMTTLLPISDKHIQCILIGFTEITNGITYTANADLPFSQSYPLIMAYTAFGGLSGIAQTASMVKDTHFSLKPYLFTKVFGTVTTFLLALLLVQ